MGAVKQDLQKILASDTRPICFQRKIIYHCSNDNNSGEWKDVQPGLYCQESWESDGNEMLINLYHDHHDHDDHHHYHDEEDH